MKNYESKNRKIPILSDEELIDLEKIMYSNINDKLSKKRFWKKVYEKRGLDYKK